MARKKQRRFEFFNTLADYYAAHYKKPVIELGRRIGLGVKSSFENGNIGKFGKPSDRQLHTPDTHINTGWTHDENLK